eukprot:g13303.t1
MLPRWQRLEDAKQLAWGKVPSSFKPAIQKKAGGQATAALALQNMVQLQALALSSAGSAKTVADEREALRQLEQQQLQEQSDAYFFGGSANNYGASGATSSSSVGVSRPSPYGSFGSASNTLSMLSGAAVAPQEFAPLMDSVEDLQLLQQGDPELFFHERISERVDVHSSIRGGDQGGSFSLQLPNRVNVQDRRAEGGLISENVPPRFFREEDTQALRADIALAPDARHGKAASADLSWAAAVELGVEFPKPDEGVHAAAEGDTSDEEKADLQRHVDAIKGGSFAPVSSGQLTRATVLAYEKQFSSKYRPLMKARGLSGKRKNFSSHSLGLLQKVFGVCGDFPQSRHTSAPLSPIPLCPVCALDDKDWDIMQRMMKIQADARKKAKEQRQFEEDDALAQGLADPDEDKFPSQVKWSAAICNLVEMAGIPNPRVGADLSRGRTGRLTWNSYSVRVGGAQSARDGGADEDMIMALGRWLSPKVKEHYKGLSACLPDVIRIAWPVRKGHLYSQSTNFNTNSDWAAGTALKLAHDI